MPRKLEQQLNIRLTDGLYGRLKGYAGGAGVSIPSAARNIIADRLAVDDPNDRAIYWPRQPEAEDIQALRVLRSTTAQLAGTLVQTSIKCREVEADTLHSAVEAALAEVKSVVRDMDKTVKKLSRAS